MTVLLVQQLLLMVPWYLVSFQRNFGWFGTHQIVRPKMAQSHSALPIKAQGFRHRGGKPDDITVLVARVVADEIS